MATPALRLDVSADDRATRILSDVTKNLEKTGKKAQEAGKKVASGSREMDKSLKKVKDSAGSLQGGVSKLRTAMGVLFVGVGIAGVLRGTDTLLRALAVQEQAVADLSLGYKNLGVFTQEAVDDQTAYAASLQKTTKFGDESIISLQAQLTAFGLYGDKLKQATQATLDLSTRLKVSLQTASLLVGKAAQGMTNSLRSYGIVVDDSLPKNEKFAAAMAAINKQMGGAAQEQLGNYAGKVANLSNRMGDLQERLGKELVPVFEFWADIVDETLGKLEDLGREQDLGIARSERQVRFMSGQIAMLETQIGLFRKQGLSEEQINKTRDRALDRLEKLKGAREREILKLREAKTAIDKVNSATNEEIQKRKEQEEAAASAAEARDVRSKKAGENIKLQTASAKEFADIEKALQMESLELAGRTFEVKREQILAEKDERIAALDALGVAGKISAEEVSEAMELAEQNATASLENLERGGVKSFQGLVGPAKQAANAIESGFASAFADIVFEGKASAEDLRKTWESLSRSILEDIARLGIRKFITAPLFGIPFGGGAQHGETRVPGPVGAPRVMTVHGGEEVVPFGGTSRSGGGGGGGGGGTVQINISLHVADLEASERARVVEALTTEVRDASKEIREFAGELGILQARTQGDAT